LKKTTASKPIVRRVTKEDIEAFAPGKTAPSLKGWCMVVDDKVIGIGGLAHAAGRWFAFCDLSPEARKYKITIYKIGLMVMRAAREAGHKHVFAHADLDEPMSLRWLESQGFQRQPQSGLYLWQASSQDQ
jgi:hypothetical protein